MDVRVLVVDDQPSYLDVACAVVEMTPGFALVGTASSGEEAVEAAPRLRPDLVVMDVRLPGIDGITAAHRIRASAPAPVVLLVSTYDIQDLDPERVADLPYLSKSALLPASLAAVWRASGT